MHRRKDEVTGQSRLHDHGCSLPIPNLTHHDDVRILAHDTAQSARKVEAYVRLNLNLIDAGKLILDGVFERDDFYLGTVDPAHEGIKARGLARSCGSGQKNDARRHLEVFKNLRFNVG